MRTKMSLGLCKTPVYIVDVCSSQSDNARPWCDRTQLTTIFVGDQLAVGGQIVSPYFTDVYSFILSADRLRVCVNAVQLTERRFRCQIAAPVGVSKPNSSVPSHTSPTNRKQVAVSLCFSLVQEAKLSLGQPTVLPHSRVRLSIAIDSDCCYSISICFRDIWP